MSLSTVLWTVTLILSINAVALLIYYLYLVYAPARKPARASVSPNHNRQKQENKRITGENEVADTRPPARHFVNEPEVEVEDYDPTVSSNHDLGGFGYLSVLGGLRDRNNIMLPAESFSIGRFRNEAKNVLLLLDEKTVSREHAMMRCNVRAREFYIQDLNSTYGTFLVTADETIRLEPLREHQIYNDDVLQFGNAVRVQVHILTESRSSVTRLE